jgi:hypothetical protein
VPVKARVVVGGADLRAGAAALVATACDGATALAAPVRVAMGWQPGADRWMALLPTSLFPAGCFRVDLILGEATGDPATSAASGTAAAGFTLWVDPPPSKGSKSR